MSATWTLVSEEMPDSDTTVLICAPSDTDPVWLGYHDGEDWRGVHGGVLNHKVTHWMDLPEMPEEKGGAR